MIRFVPLFFLSLCALIPQVHASAFDLLLEDIQLLEEDMAVRDAEEKLESTQEMVESQEELFPLLSGESETEPLRTSTVVEVMINGTLVALQDVPLVQWFAQFVQDVANRGIISGYKNAAGTPLGTYGPGDSVTIEQLAKMVLEATKTDISSCSSKLLNTRAKGQWSQQYIACAESKGFAVYSDGGVDIARPAKRNEVMVTVLQAFAIPFSGDLTGVFTDVKASTQFARAIETAAKDGIVSGHTDAQGKLTGTFGPNTNVNRAEMAKILSLALQAYGE